MITVKQYADERGITIQAVHQSMQGKRKKEKLEGHVQVIDGVKWLDEVAVEILDSSRQKSPIVVDREDAAERIAALEDEIKKLLVKTTKQAETISELATWKAEKALAIAESEVKQQQLIALQERVDGFAAEKEAAIKEETEKMELQYKMEIKDLRAELERDLTWKERLTGKRKKG